MVRVAEVVDKIELLGEVLGDIGIIDPVYLGILDLRVMYVEGKVGVMAGFERVGDVDMVEIEDGVEKVLEIDVVKSGDLMDGIKSVAVKLVAVKLVDVAWYMGMVSEGVGGVESRSVEKS